MHKMCVSQMFQTQASKAAKSYVIDFLTVKRTLKHTHTFFPQYSELITVWYDAQLNIHTRTHKTKYRKCK